MNKTIHAVFENGVFRPVDAVDLPEDAKVEFEPRLIAKEKDWPEGYFQKTAGALEREVFERPDQGMLPDRGQW